MSAPTQDDPRRGPFQAAHDVTGHLISVLTPLPTLFETRCPDDGPVSSVRAYAHKDRAALHAWQGIIGGELARTVRKSGQIYWSLTTIVDGIRVELWTLLDAPVADGAE